MLFFVILCYFLYYICVTIFQYLVVTIVILIYCAFDGLTL